MLALDQTEEHSFTRKAVTVGLSAAHAFLCRELIADAGLEVEVACGALHVACDDIAKTLPQVVVTSDAIGSDALAVLEDVAVAVGAVFLVLDDESAPEIVALDIEAAVVVASARAEHRSSRPPAP